MSSPVKVLSVIEERKNLRKRSKIHSHLRYGYFVTVNQYTNPKPNPQQFKTKSTQQNKMDYTIKNEIKCFRKTSWTSSVNISSSKILHNVQIWTSVTIVCLFDSV